MNPLDEIFKSLLITPEQQMRLKNHEASFRQAQRADMEMREEELDASLTRAEQKQRNIKYYVQQGMSAVPVWGGDE